MTLIRSLVFYIIFYLGSVPIVIIAAGSALFGQEAVIATSRVWAKFHQFCVRALIGIRTVVEGEFPTAGIIAMKHEAMFETVEILRLIDRPAVVFKAELMKVPLWGAVALRHGVIPVARETGSAALRQMLKASRQAVADCRPIVIFPEGTRVSPGERPALRSGVAGLYKALGLPVVPVAVDSGKLWPKTGILKHAGTVTFKIGTPIPAGLSREEIETRIHAAINALN